MLTPEELKKNWMEGFKEGLRVNNTCGKGVLDEPGCFKGVESGYQPYVRDAAWAANHAGYWAARRMNNARIQHPLIINGREY